MSRATWNLWTSPSSSCVRVYVLERLKDYWSFFFFFLTSICGLEIYFLSILKVLCKQNFFIHGLKIKDQSTQQKYFEYLVWHQRSFWFFQLFKTRIFIFIYSKLIYYFVISFQGNWDVGNYIRLSNKISAYSFLVLFLLWHQIALISVVYVQK